ncbi:hypothetical protein BGZ50_005051 [Haplosporangium sp. Z 11]|nr:hypothetical protein BGZ50_005051 [Haplosporangium sp. Z 11]
MSALGETMRMEGVMAMQAAHPSALPRKAPCHQPRYSFRERTQKKQHEPPKTMKEYGWKSWKEKPKSPSDSDTAPPSQKEKSDKPKKKSGKPKKPHVEGPVREMDKQSLLRALNWEHSTATLDIGTLSANVNRALANEPDLMTEIQRCLQESYWTLSVHEFLTTVKVDEEQDNDDEKGNNEEQDNDDEWDNDEEDSTNSEHMQKFIDRLGSLGLLHEGDPASQLTVRFPLQQLQPQSVKGRLPAECDIGIHPGVSSIENFVRLNKINKNRRRLVPMTPSNKPFISFSEIELFILFWKSNVLKKYLQKLIGSDDYSIVDAQEWFSLQEPEFLVARLLTDAGRGKASQRRKPGAGKSVTAAVHLEFIRQPTFNPNTYDSKGYVLRGSIRTDGFCLQLLTFKLKELKSIRYKRLPANVLPPRLTSTVGGTGYYLTEVRNVVKAQQDVTVLWGCRPEEIKILSLDLGQACVIGASALLPDEPEKPKKGKKVQRDQDGDAPTEEPSGTMKSDPRPAIYYNLALKRKAVYQPIFKLRPESISDIKSRLPPLRGDDANITNYVTELGSAKEQLDAFYNTDMSVKKHRWDARKAFDAEFAIITDCLLKMVGGAAGWPRDEANKIVIGVGLGKFSTKTRLSSLHTSFQSYFVQKVYSTTSGVGVNEYYTSKKCPTCERFVGELMYQRRPLYLQPMDANGRYVWEQAATSQTVASTSASSSRTSTSASTSTSGQQGARARKRAASEEGPAARCVPRQE